MLRPTKRESDSLLKNGVLMIVLGTAVSALATLMAKPTNEHLGYVSAAMFLSLGLLIALVTQGLRNFGALPRPVTVAYVAIGVLIACYVLFSGIQRGSLEMPLVGVIAGVLSLYWASRYITLASGFRAHSPQAIGLCALAAANSSFGVSLATETRLSKLGIVALAGYDVILLGVQVYLIALFLHRSVMRERAFERR